MDNPLKISLIANIVFVLGDELVDRGAAAQRGAAFRGGGGGGGRDSRLGRGGRCVKTRGLISGSRVVVERNIMK